ncbi:MAG: MptD family putative ECF transporter S component [Bacteroidaceae bacterium]
MKPVFKIILLAIAYLATFFLGASTGIIHPACYAYVGALLPFITAFIYKAMVKQVPGFGAASIMNGFVIVLFLLVGEADANVVIGMIILATLSEFLHSKFKADPVKSLRWGFVPMAFSYFTYTAHWWTDTEGSLAAAVEEMRPGYDQLMIPVIDNIPVLILVYLITIPLAILAIRLATK